MSFKLEFTNEAAEQFGHLEKAKSLVKRLKSVRKALGYLETNPRHQGLNTHKYSSLAGPNSEDVFEAYAENNTPGAYRIFWYYGPGKNKITILAITGSLYQIQSHCRISGRGDGALNKPRENTLLCNSADCANKISR